MKRSVLNLLGGLLLCLPMLFTSCSEKDNSLEQIVNQPNLEGLQKALYKNAEVTIEYKVYQDGQSVANTVTLKNVGTVEKPEFELDGEIQDPGYDLTCDMGYIDGNLYFGLLYKSPDPNADAEDEDEADDLFDLSPVMVVKFDTKTSKYDVYALPGFDFDVISINGANIDVARACTDEATIKFQQIGYGGGNARALMRSYSPTTLPFEMKLNLNGVNNWGDLDKAYDEVGLGVFAFINDLADADDQVANGDIVIDLSDYDFYFNNIAQNYWKTFVIFDQTEQTKQDKDKSLTSGGIYMANAYANQIYIPCFGLNSNNRIALVDMLTLKMPTTPGDNITWNEIVAVNPGIIKIAYSTPTKPTVVGEDNVIGDNGGYYALYDNVHHYARVNATDSYVYSKFYTYDFHFSQLKDSYKQSDAEYTAAVAVTSR